MMPHGGMLWGAALYNNGSFPFKNTQFGEIYTRDGTAGASATRRRADAERRRAPTGVLPFLQPLFPWEVTQPGNILRIFERGGTQAARDRHPRSRRRAGPAERTA